MAKPLFMFNIQGSVWNNQIQNLLYVKNNIIKITNTRNLLTDSDIIGATGGNCPDPGWYSITLASLKNNRTNGVVFGDELKIVILSEQKQTVLYDLGIYKITREDIKLGGVVIDFDLAQ